MSGIVWVSLTTGVLLLGSLAHVYRQQQKEKRTRQLHRAEDELHPLLKDHTQFRSFTTAFAAYPRIRTFYRPHSHLAKHVDITELPLLVFVHGLGGVLPQFAGLLGSLANIAPCFGLELPGHGRSSFEPKDYSAYSIDANVSLWKTAIEAICQEYGHKGVVLIGHSMGCSISSLLASSTSATRLSVPVLGVVAICPRARPLSEHEVKALRNASYIPNIVLNIMRWLDRRGGENSKSVKRVVGDSKETDLKRTQLAWNRQYRTSVLKRISAGLLPRKTSDGQMVGGYPSEAVWTGIDNPLLLISGASDTVCKPEECDRIVQYITGNATADAAKLLESADALQSSTNDLVPTTIKTSSSVIQAIILPPPAAHAVLYAHTTYRLVSALVESFLTTHVSEKLDFAYQLRLLTTAGKWDVKNLEKWKAVLLVSGPICQSPREPNGLFLALKTMREQDDEHNPTKFMSSWSSKIYAVIDISHETPVYNTKLLGKGGVEYHKFPTVSKIPPTPVEVQDFCSLVDKLIAERDAKEADESEKRAIAVHCHYGYNRTGFFICSYLISRKGFGVQESVDEFKQAKPPGIRHEHFLDVLWLRFVGHTVSSGKGVRSDKTRVKQEKANAAGETLALPDREDSGNVSDNDLI